MQTIELKGDIDPSDATGFANRFKAWLALPSIITLEADSRTRAQEILNPTTQGQLGLFLKYQDRRLQEHLKKGDYPAAFELADRGIEKASDKPFESYERPAAAVQFWNSRGLVRETFGIRELPADAPQSGDILISAANEYMKADLALGAATPNALRIARLFIAVGFNEGAIAAAVSYLGPGEFAVGSEDDLMRLEKAAQEIKTIGTSAPDQRLRLLKGVPTTAIDALPWVKVD